MRHDELDRDAAALSARSSICAHDRSACAVPATS
jgi:hypothetical protein